MIEICFTNTFQLARLAFILVYMIVVNSINVKTQASMKEKDWVIQTLGYFAAFFFLVYAVVMYRYTLAMCFLVLKSDVRLIVIVARIFFAGTFQLISNFIDGFTLNHELPADERLYDSSFIHISRLLLLFFVPFFVAFVLTSTCCLCYLAQNRDEMDN